MSIGLLGTEMETAELTRRLRVLLPETYQVFDQAVQPRSMGSAGLKFGPDGKVLWGEMWASFCHLAMAGGPPHRGTLLQPPVLSAHDAASAEYAAVAGEIARGIELVTGLCAEPSASPGWLRMYCTSAAMAGWLLRAIVMENVAAKSQGLSLCLPVGPAFRVEKEIKNVITSVAKTCHYWQDHMSDAQRDEIADLLAVMEREAPLVPIALGADLGESADIERAQLASRVQAETGLAAVDGGSPGWLGIECGSVAASIWMMRALCVCNLLARREGTVLFVPLNWKSDPAGERTAQGLIEAHRLATAFHVFG